ncbi:MAG: alpha-L-rhamnosidase-related protein [Pirellulaceae bacterium]
MKRILLLLLVTQMGVATRSLPAQDAAAPVVPPGTVAAHGQEKSGWRPLFDGKSLEGWEVVKGYDYQGQGKVEVQEGCLVLGAGQPATGVRWTGKFPHVDYEVELEGRRVAGYDFFCGMSFPVGEGSLTLILGGWGGWAVGLSCIDGYRAIDNETCTSWQFKDRQWYRIRVTVTGQKVSVYLDDKYLCGIDTPDRKLTVTSEMEPCLPFGFATWNTTGALRNIRYRPLNAAGSAADTPLFASAKPVWPAGRETEMNLTTGFRALFASPASARVALKIAASTVYRVWLNGSFVAIGPARGPHGYYRVDELDLSRHVKAGENVLAVEVAGYNVNSYDVLDQPSFLQAEVVADGERVLAATGSADLGFDALICSERLQKVQRYSFQRPFIEVYRLTPAIDAWRTSITAIANRVALSEVPAKQFLPRRVLLPQFEIRFPEQLVAQGRLLRHNNVENPWKDRSLVDIGPKFKGYPEDQLEVIPSLEIQTLGSHQQQALSTVYDPGSPLALAAGDYRILDLGTNLTGLVGATLACTEKSRCWFVFDEILSEGDVDFKRLGCVNLVSYELEPGRYEVESIEPYTMRYLKVICVDGQCAVSNVHLREYKHPNPQQAAFECSDPQLNELYRAGVETFRQNALDIFMDCPSRERAGWLCDSYFTARVAQDLTGTTLVEQNFFENFLLPERFEHLPPGMLPMCYPADHPDGVFIPNWSLWFVVQLEEYLARSGDQQMVDSLQEKVLKLFEYFEALENSDGLLEKLQGWVFVEWSAANGFVQDVNYPSNMLYAGALAAAGRMYDLPALRDKADQLRKVIGQQSFDGHFFVDNAVRTEGKLEVTKNRSEVCQYFAFQFGVASPETHPELWRILREQFGPDRKQTKAFWDEVHVANSFIGNMLRFELLSRYGCQQQILDESTAYLLYMAERTGTLWENDGAYASCNHGFASHIVHTLYRDVLGVAHLDMQEKTIRLKFADVRLQWCRGSLPTAAGPVQLRWERQGDELVYSIRTPEGYQVQMENASGRKITTVEWKD